MSKKFYVYKVFLKEEVVYIGKGQGSRCSHVLSGKSHNAKLNEYYYRHTLLGDECPVVKKVKYFENEDECLAHEEKLILELLPECNIRLCTGNSTCVKDSYLTFDILEKNYLHYKNSTTLPPLTMYMWLSNKINNTSKGDVIKQIMEDNMEKVMSHRITNGGAPKTFKGLLGMTEGEYCAFKRYCKKVGVKLKDLSVDSEEDFGFVKAFLSDRRSSS